MIISTVFIRFNLKPHDMNQKGLAPIRCRLTYNKKRKDFSTGLSVKPKDHTNYSATMDVR